MQKSIQGNIVKNGLDRENVVKELDLSHVSTLEKRLFFAIMQNTQIMTKENREYVLMCLPSPLNDICRAPAGALQISNV